MRLHCISLLTWNCSSLSCRLALNLGGVILPLLLLTGRDLWMSKGFAEQEWCKVMAPIFFHLVRVTRVSKIKLVPYLCLTCCFSHLATGGPEENGRWQPGPGHQPQVAGLSRRDGQLSREMSLWGKNSEAMCLVSSSCVPGSPHLAWRGWAVWCTGQ